MVATNDIALVGDNKSVVVKRARPVGLKVSARPATARRVGRTCRNPACSKNPYFGWHGEKAIYCVTHKEPGEWARPGPSCCRRSCFGALLFPEIVDLPLDWRQGSGIVATLPPGSVWFIGVVWVILCLWGLLTFWLCWLLLLSHSCGSQATQCAGTALYGRVVELASKFPAFIGLVCRLSVVTLSCPSLIIFFAPFFLWYRSYLSAAMQHTKHLGPALPAVP